MEKIFTNISIGFMFVLTMLMQLNAQAQNAVVGDGFSNGWGDLTSNSNFEFLSASAGTSYIKTDVANGTGNQYFRMGKDWGGNFGQYTLTPSSDVAVSHNTEYTLNSSSTLSGTMYLNVSSVTDNYVFKTKDAGTLPLFKLIIFRVEGDIRTVTNVSQLPTNVYKGQDVTVTANLDAALNTGQGVYLRYSNDNFATSSVVTMIGSGTTYSYNIPAAINVAGANIKYYVFTSGSGLTISGANADWYTINLNNNSGSNYSYSVVNAIVSQGTGYWFVGSTWVGGTVPPPGSAVAINHTVTLNDGGVTTANVSSLTINPGGTFVGSEGLTARTLQITSGGSFSNNGTFTSSSGTISFLGSGSINGSCSFKNVTIAGGGVDFGTNSTITGTLTISAGGSVVNKAPIYGSSSTLKYSTGGSYNRSIEWSTMSAAGYPNNVQISGSTTLNVNNGANIQLKIAGNLAVDIGSTFSMQNMTIPTETVGVIVTGNIVNSGSITLASSTERLKTINFTNSGTTTLSSELGGDLEITGNLTDEGTFVSNTRAVFFTGGSNQEILSETGSNDIDYIVINKTGNSVLMGNDLVCDGPNGGSAITLTSANDVLDLNGYDITLGTAGVNSGISGLGKFKGNPTSSMEIFGTGAFGSVNFSVNSGENELLDLTINRTGVLGSVVIGNGLIVNGSLTLKEGSLEGSIQYGSSGILIYDGPSYIKTSDVEFPSNNGPKDVKITALCNIGLGLHANRTISGNLNIANSGKIIIPPLKQLSVSGSVTNVSNTGITIQSDISGTGSLIQNSNNVKATVQRYITGGWDNLTYSGWHQISSPVTSQAIAGFASSGAAGDNYDFYGWNEVDNLWMNYKEPDFSDWNGGTSNFVVGRGYLISYEQAVTTKSFGGTLNRQDISFSNLTETQTNTSYMGWHLLGNPFPSAIKWNDGNWALTNVAGNAKIWNSSAKSYSTITPGSYIPISQGFMIQVDDPTNSITIPLASREHNSTPWYKSKTEESRIFLLASESLGNSSQESIIMPNESATDEFDFYYDSRFLAGYAPIFYSLSGTEKLALNSLKAITEETVIPFGFVKNTASDYTIELKESIEGYKVFLKDLKANVDHNLTANHVYAFTSLEGDDANRFLLHFESTLGTDDTEKPEQLSMYYNNGSVFVSGAAGKAELFVRNMLGQVVIQQTVNGDGLQVVNTGNLADGVYVVSLVGSGSTKSQKIVIK